MTMFSKPGARGGFTLAEVVTAMLVVAVLTAVAIPFYLQAKQKAYKQVASSDAMNLANEVAQALSTYPNLGSTAGTITLRVEKNGTASTGTLEFVLGSGVSSPAALTLQVSDQTTAYGSTKASSRGWCLDTVNRGRHVVYTETGLQPTANSCTVAGVASATVVPGGGLSAS